MLVSRLLATIFALAATGACAEEAYDVEITGVGLSRDVHCDEGQSIRITGIQNRIEVSGACKLVLVDLADNEVTVERADALQIFGSKQKVIASQAVRLLEVHGADHVVDLTLAGEGANASVTGSKNALAVMLRSKATLSVAGSQHDVTYRRGTDVPKPGVNMSGADNRVREDRTSK